MARKLEIAINFKLWKSWTFGDGIIKLIEKLTENGISLRAEKMFGTEEGVCIKDGGNS